MSQTSALNLAEVKMGLNAIDTRILEVCERSECVPDQFFELERGSKEMKMGLNSVGTRILEVCERLEWVADQCIKLGRVQGGKNVA